MVGMKPYDMICVSMFVVPWCSGVGVRGVRGPGVLNVFGQDRWMSEKGSLGLVNQKVGFSLALGMVRVIWSLLTVCGFWIRHPFFS